MGMPYSKQDFLNRLAQGNKTENYVAEQLVKAGITVEQPEYPEGMSRSYYTKNQVDMVANGFILEIKGRNQHFESLSDYPYDTMFVEGTTGFDAKVNRPDFYITVSNPTGCIIALDVASTIDSWTIKQITDRARGYSYPMYISQTADWMDFEKFVEVLNDRTTK